MLFNILTGNKKGLFPAGYKHKKGTLCSGTTATIPANLQGKVIPLVVKINGGRCWTGYSDDSSYFYVTDGTKTYLYIYTPNGRAHAEHWGDSYVWVPALYGYDWAAMGKITNIRSQFQWGGGEQTNPTIAITEWLEKSGGGALKCSKNPFVKRYFNAFEKCKNTQEQGGCHAV